MRVVFDTDVTLDLLLDRKPFSESVALLFSMAERERIEGYLCATTITTIHYLASKILGSGKARASIRKLISFMKVAPVDNKVTQLALDGKCRDFEDEVISQAASYIGAKAIITRNIKDFKGSVVPAYLPDEFLKALNEKEYE